MINAFARLDVAKLWGDGHVVAADGSQVNTWENNLLAETSIRRPIHKLSEVRLDWVWQFFLGTPAHNFRTIRE